MSDKTPDEMSAYELHAAFDEECGIRFCAYCGKPLAFTREEMIEFLDSGCVLVECRSPDCKRTYYWGDY